MSEKTIKRSVGYNLLNSMLIAVGLRAALQKNDWGKPAKVARFRNNWTAKTSMKVNRVNRWRKANRVAKASRTYNRQRNA